MSSKAKWLTAALTVATWVGWLTCYTASEVEDIGLVLLIAREALRVATIVSSIILALGCMVAPAIATARVWREIGVREQRQRCSCSVTTKRAALTNIIPVSFNGSVSRIGDPLRDN